MSLPDIVVHLTKLQRHQTHYTEGDYYHTVGLEKTVRPGMTKHILKVRTQMVERIYKYFDVGFSESHRVKLYICTLLDPRFKNS